jgi:hypothetical protein
VAARRGGVNESKQIIEAQTHARTRKLAVASHPMLYRSRLNTIAKSAPFTSAASNHLRSQHTYANTTCHRASSHHHTAAMHESSVGCDRPRGKGRQPYVPEVVHKYPIVDPRVRGGSGEVVELRVCGVVHRCAAVATGEPLRPDRCQRVAVLFLLLFGIFAAGVGLDSRAQQSERALVRSQSIHPSANAYFDQIHHELVQLGVALH